MQGGSDAGGRRDGAARARVRHRPVLGHPLRGPAVRREAHAARRPRGQRGRDPTWSSCPATSRRRATRSSSSSSRATSSLIECPERVVIAGQPRLPQRRLPAATSASSVRGTRTASFALPARRARRELKVLAVDSNIPDLNDGEVGREKVERIAEEFAERRALRVFVLHHHLVSIPGTGTGAQRRVGRGRRAAGAARRRASTSCSRGTSTSRTPGRSRGCSSSRAGRRPRTGRAATTEPSYNLIRVTRERDRRDDPATRRRGGSTETFPRQRRPRPGTLEDDDREVVAEARRPRRRWRPRRCRVATSRTGSPPNPPNTRRCRSMPNSSLPRRASDSPSV